MLTVAEDKRMKILDAMRALAILAVFFFHSALIFTLPYNSDYRFNWHRLIYAGGTVGVSVFFILSGFLLFYQLAKKNENLNKQKLSDYFKKRALRILPLYYFSLFFIVLFLNPEILSAADGPRSIIYNLFFLRAIDGANATPTINPVYWSLIVELHFYILLPVFYYLYWRYQRLVWFIALASLGLIYRTALVVFVDHPSMMMMRATPANFDFFAWGMLGAHFYLHPRPWLNLISKYYLQFLLLITFLAFIYFFDLEFAPTVSYILAPLFLGAVVTFTMLSFLTNENSILSKFFSSTFFYFISLVSYSIFIWHIFIIEAFGKLSWSGPVKLLLSFILTILVSTISYYLIEKPFLKLKKICPPVS